MQTAWIVWAVWGALALLWFACERRTSAGAIGTLTLGVLPWACAGVLLAVWAAARWFYGA